MFTQRLGIHFSSEDVKNPCHFECPHRLSDKLLKSSATRLSLTVARWRILRFPLSESTRYFRIFSLQPTGLFVKWFTSAVSMEAHYREFPSIRNSKIAEKWLTAAFPSKTPLYTLLRTELSTGGGRYPLIKARSPLSIGRDPGLKRER